MYWSITVKHVTSSFALGSILSCFLLRVHVFVPFNSVFLLFESMCLLVICDERFWRIRKDIDSITRHSRPTHVGT